MLRGAKNTNGVIIAFANDQDQSGNYPIGATDEAREGVWCTWTVAEDGLPAFSEVAGAVDRPLRFKENVTADGIELRSDADVLANPNG